MMLGLGQYAIPTTQLPVPSPSTTVPIDCTTFWDWLIYPSCANAPNNWITAGIQNKFYGLPEPPMPPAVGQPPINPDTGNVTDPCAADPSACITQVTADQVTQWQAANQAFFNSLPIAQQGPGITGPLLLMAGAAAVLYFSLEGVRH